MVAEETKKAAEAAIASASEAPPPPVAEPVKASKEVVEEKEKSVVVQTPHPPADDKPHDSKALPIVGKTSEAALEKKSEGSIDRDAELARVANEKRLSLIKAWEESEKSKVGNKAQKKLSAIGAWENSKKAALEAEIRKIEEKLEKKKAEYVEKMKNKVALLHKSAEEQRAIIEAKRGEDILKAEEMAAKYRATGTAPKKLLGCF